MNALCQFERLRWWILWAKCDRLTWSLCVVFVVFCVHEHCCDTEENVRFSSVRNLRHWGAHTTHTGCVEDGEKGAFVSFSTRPRPFDTRFSASLHISVHVHWSHPGAQTTKHSQSLIAETFTHAKVIYVRTTNDHDVDDCQDDAVSVCEHLSYRLHIHIYKVNKICIDSNGSGEN